MSRLCYLLVFLLLAGCAPAPPELKEPPNVHGALPGQTVWEAAASLGPLEEAMASAEEEDVRVFNFDSGRLETRAGVIDKLYARTLNVGENEIESGGQSPEEIARIWGQAESRFERDGRELVLYSFAKYRYELLMESDKLVEVEITAEPVMLPPGNHPFGQGVLGDDLGNEPGLTLNGAALGWSRSRLEKSLGRPNDKFWGDATSFGEEAVPVVGFADGRVRWILGQELKREERVLVKVGMTVEQATQNLSTVARVKQYTGSRVTYTFLNVGDVTLALEAGQVRAIELFDPEAKS